MFSRLLIPCALLGALLAGCSGGTESASSGTEPTTTAAKTADLPAGITEYRNADGKLECPIMKQVVEDPSTAEFVDYEGVRYYMCCKMCSGKAKENPAILKEKAGA